MKVVDFYNTTAHNYDKRLGNATVKYVRGFEKKLIRKYAKGSILDVGCGTGVHLGMLRSSVGLDASENMLLEAKNKSDSPLIKSVAELLPLKPGSFGTILCMFSVLNLCDFENAVREMNRVLKKDGLAIVSVAGIWDRYDKPLKERLKDAKSKRKSVRIEGFRLSLHLFSKEDLTDLFRRQGFDIVEFHGMFKLQKPYWGWYRNFTTAEKIRLKIFDKLLPSKTGRMYFGVFKKI